MKKKIVFLTHTNYHFLVAITLISNCFYDKELFEVTILKTVPLKNKPTGTDGNETVLLNQVYIKEITYSENLALPKKTTLDYIHNLTNSNVDQFIIFNQHSFLAIYLSYQLCRKAKIILAPDGAKPYGSSHKFTPRWSSITAIRFQWFLIRNRLFTMILHYPTIVYGDLRPVDEVWVQYSNAYNNLSGKKVREINVLQSPDSILLTKQYFGFTEEVGSDREGVLFYLNQPFRNKRLYEFELSFLQQLLCKFPNRLLTIKVHPSTEKKQLEKLFKLRGKTRIIKDDIPAELYILNMSRSVLFSFWSSAIFIHNPTCLHYWAYPILGDMGLLPSYFNIVHPSDHILLVNQIDQIKFP